MADTAADVITLAAQSFLNDYSQALYTNTLMLPLVKAAVLELQQRMLESGVTTVEANTTVTMEAVVDLNLTTATDPALPTDLLLPITLLERANGSGNDYVPMLEVEQLPERDQDTTIREWVWEADGIYTKGATVATDIKIVYQKTLGAITLTTSTITALGAKLLLTLKVASLAARTIGNNPVRADELEKMYSRELNSFLVAKAKETQSYPARRLPYGYLRRQLRRLRLGR